MRIGLGLGLGGSSPVAGAAGELWFEEPLVSTSTLNNYTLVVVLRPDDVSSPEVPELSVAGISILVEGVVGKLYAGIKAASGDDYDAASLVQVTFDGQAGTGDVAATDVTESDVVPFEWNGEDYLIFSVYTGVTNSKVRNKSFTNYADLYAKSGVDEASSADKAGYDTMLGNNLFCVRGVRLFDSVE